MKTLSRSVTILVFALFAASCKIHIIVPEGGRVASESGAYSCESGQICEIDVVDIFFDETFKAEPKQGHFFRKWEAVQGSFCGDKIDQPCRLTTTVFAGIDALRQWLESDAVFYLRPMFNEGSCQQKREEDSEKIDGVRFVDVEEYQECTSPISEPVIHGESRYSTNGKLRQITIYDLSAIVELTAYREDGLVWVRKKVLSNGTILSWVYDSSGLLKIRGWTSAPDDLALPCDLEFPRFDLCHGDPLKEESYLYRDGLHVETLTRTFVDNVIVKSVRDVLALGTQFVFHYSSDGEKIYHEQITPAEENGCTTIGVVGLWYFRVEYSNGMRHGPFQSFSCNGNTSSGQYVNGKKHGVQYHYYADGTLRYTETWEDGELIGRS